MQDTLQANNETFDESTLPPARQTSAIGERLCLAREALRLSQAKFALRAGMSPNAYNQFERGKRRLTIDGALKIHDAHGLTLDWIYLGDCSGLKPALADAIEQIRPWPSIKPSP